MPHIRPVSDLRNHFAEISKIVHESSEPVFLTKNGYGDMVVMSIEQYEHLQQDNMVFQKLKEAELEAANSNVRYSHAEVMNELRKKISE
ncbi:type II toxin-antitoxin system Phd/YefM family antitoxin [Paenibacillaceae sp. P-4]|uniref:type II toxin-antitoxin system Phd/YefM family antitoxin n=1 Tax=Paenibacillus TaxID=44249 RepID=UPI000806601C|nr:type II toxin-antitoxin system Phd/YefM family antitoxin [Paenibacillus sp. KS1]OBY78604.1 prevent-host-death protein [Paenibacillus sp. KS1]